jgi:uncharacterized protein (UPF0276 family)
VALPISTASRPNPIPVQAGIGLRAPHYRELLERRSPIGWLEVHSENYFGQGGAPLHYLEQLCASYPLSLHGVGLSLGSTDPLNMAHLNSLKALIARFEPGFISEHLSWSSVGGHYLNDLLPLPYTFEALSHISQRIAQVQEYLGRQILVENISSYLQYTESSIPEWQFLTEVTQRTGCGILLDVNNIYVSATNHGFDARAYLRAMPADVIQEIHLAGFTVNRFDDGEMLIDTHSRRVSHDVWTLYREAVDLYGPIPTLIEWDTDIPPLSVLLDEAGEAARIMNQHMEQYGARVTQSPVGVR